MAGGARSRADGEARGGPAAKAKGVETAGMDYLRMTSVLTTRCLGTLGRVPQS